MISAAQIADLADRGRPLVWQIDGEPPDEPPWAEAMAAHVEWVVAHPVRTPHRATQPDRPIPFEGVLSAFVDRAAAAVVFDPTLIGEGATAQLERWLLERLAQLSFGLFDLERAVELSRQGTALEHLLSGTFESSCRPDHDGFDDQLLAGRLPQLILEYPTWARLVHHLMATWTGAVEEFLARLASDRSVLSQHCASGASLGPVTRLRAGVSDPHDGGRSVILVGFAAGPSVVYKPRDVRPEFVFSQVVDWLTRRGVSASPRSLTVVTRPGYGWVEFAPADQCRDQAEIEIYYRRAGGLLGLLHALCGTDAHFENIIASGSWPVLVDAETVLHTLQAPPGTPLDATGSARAILNDSVWSTSMLPVWRVLADGRGYDNSGLGVADRQRLDVRRRNATANERPGAESPADIAVLANVPRLDGTPMGADAHVDAIIEGFVEMYRAVVAHREELLAADGPLAAFRAVDVRVILRPTQLYGDLMFRSLRPAALRDGAAFWRRLGDVLESADAARPTSRLHVADREVNVAELQALEHLDIPRFAVKADRPVVVAPRSLAGRATGSDCGLTRAGRRIRAMDENDLRRQVSFIRAAFHCRAAMAAGDPRTPTATAVVLRARIPAPPAVPWPPGRPVLDVVRAEQLAGRIAERIQQQAILGADGSATWIIPAVQHNGRSYALRPMGSDLYSGTAGVALFLAAVGRVSGQTGYVQLALSAVMALRSTLPTASKPPLGVGGLAGLGSGVYTWVCLARILDRPDLLDHARTMARRIDRDAVRGDAAFDVVNGSAGAVMALLALAHHGADEFIVETARLCADHLIDTRSGRPASWAGPYGRLTGLAHGAAGIADALFRLAAVTGDLRYADAAYEAVQFETSVFDGVSGNWPDLREDAPGGSFMHGWCSGAPGIGLARLSSAEVSTASADDVRRAAQSTVAAGLGQRDHVCCGNLARAAFLVEAARHLNQPTLDAAASELIQSMVDRADIRGDFALVSSGQQADHVGFFQGTAGIGYQLLRFAHPDLLPQPLLIQ